MFRPVLAVAAINILSSVVTIPSPAFRNPIGGIIYDFFPPVPPNFLQIISNSICAELPGTIATDGCDDVCLLTKCWKNWVPGGVSVTLQNKNNVDCSTVDSVDCRNVCRMACDREPTTEKCPQTCGELMSSGTAYVFSRNGSCNFIGVPYVLPSEPTHVGFGFEVAPGVYVFGSVENGAGSLLIPPGSDNGFWMTTGSKEQMLATFRDPKSGFHGTLHGNVVAPYDSYKMITVDVLFTVCGTAKAAEDLYGAGYAAATNNCLDAVYNILYTYGVMFPTGVDPFSYWCPSGLP